MTDIGHEASTAPVEGAGGSAGTEGGEGAAGGEGPGEASRLLDAFQSFQTDVGGRLSQIEQRFAEPEQDEEDTEDFDPSLYEIDPNGFSDDDFSDDGELTPEAQQRAFAEMVQRAARAEAEKLVNPLIEQRMDEQRDAYAAQLEQQYPELVDPQVQDRYISDTVEAAQRIGRPELAREPQFFEMVYLAAKARERAGQEIPAGSTQGVALERGGSAGPADAVAQPDNGDGIVNAYTSRHYRLGQATR